MRIKNYKPEESRIWFVSDTHYNHKNICLGTSNWVDKSKTRDFLTLEEMNSAIVENINNNVKENDILFHLGDFSFGGLDSIFEFREKIKCKNIHLILGNHDHHILKNKNNTQSLFKSVNNYEHLVVGINNVKHTFVLMHYPIASWDGLTNGVMHLHGHVHLFNDERLGPGKMMDVGMDGNNLTPISIEEVVEILSKRSIKSLIKTDHHVE